MAAEDKLYRTSTQYKYWSFTPEKLASLRFNTNALAAEHVRTAIKRKREARGTQPSSTDVSDVDKSGPENGARDTAPTLREIECLTAEEELTLVSYYCEVCIAMAKTPGLDFPAHVVATAIQYLRRFYLSNSPMTYHPKVIMPGCLYLATKTENYYISAKAYGERLSANSRTKMTEEDVIAPEFTIIQGLRFTMDVRHPHLGLKGGYMELIEMARGHATLLEALRKTPEQVQIEMLRIPQRAGQPPVALQTSATMIDRIDQAYSRAGEILKTKALLTDAYFLFTPAQIWLSALLVVDKPLLHFFLSTKIDLPSPFAVPGKAKILAVLRDCATVLEAGPEAEHAQMRKSLAVQVDKKLYHCQNPDKVDLVGLNKAQKRDQAIDGKLDESKAKRRKLEREASMQEDPFGPPL